MKHLIVQSPVVVSIFLSISLLSGCNPQSGVEDPRPGADEEILIDIGNPLAPGPTSDLEPTPTDLAGGESLLRLSEGLDGPPHDNPKVKEFTGPQTYEVTLTDGSKIRGTLIDLDDSASVILETEPGKRITIPSSGYTSIRMLFPE